MRWRLWRKRRLLAGEDLVKSGVTVSVGSQKFLHASRRAERRDRVTTGAIGGAALLALVAGGGKYFSDLGRAKAEAEADRATAMAKRSQVAEQRADEEKLAAVASKTAAEKATDLAEQRGKDNRHIVADVAIAADDCMKLREIAQRAQKQMAALAAAETPPPPPASDGPEKVTVPGADLVIGSLGGRFSACYQAGLQTDPQMRGKVVITARISPQGDVLAVQNSFNTGISFGVASCVAQAIKNAHFTAPGGGGATLLPIPVVFAPHPPAAPRAASAPPAPPPVGSVNIGAINQQDGAPKE